jgi:hypothetical protein
MYGKALDSFGRKSTNSARLSTLSEKEIPSRPWREELKQDSDWVVKLRSLPEAPETYYLLN